MIRRTCAFWIAWALIGSGAGPAAAESLTARSSAPEVVVPDADATRSPVAQAQDLDRAGSYAEAERLLKPWLEAHPTDDEARALFARVLFAQGRNEAALAEYETLQRSSRDNGDYMVGLAKVLLALGRTDESIKWLERVRTATPEYEEAWQIELQALDRAGLKGAERALSLRAAAKQRFGNAVWLGSGDDSAAKAGPWQLEAGYGFDVLSNNFAPWSDALVTVTRTFAPNQALVASVRDAGRFGVRDQEVSAGWYQPLGPRLSVAVDGSLSPSHQVLPAWSAALGLSGSPFESWEVAAEARQTTYSQANTTRETFTLAKYIGPFRLAYLLAVSELPGAPLALGHAATLEWDYTDENREVLTLHTGTEMEFVAPEKLLISDVSGIDLWGRTWLGRSWGFSHGLEYAVQGTNYSYGGARLGVLLAF